MLLASWAARWAALLSPRLAPIPKSIRHLEVGQRHRIKRLLRRDAPSSCVAATGSSSSSSSCPPRRWAPAPCGCRASTCPAAHHQLRHLCMQSGMQSGRRSLLLSPSLLPLPQRELIHLHLAQRTLDVTAGVMRQRRRLGGLVRRGAVGTEPHGWAVGAGWRVRPWRRMRLLHRRQVTGRNHRRRKSSISGRTIAAWCARVDGRERWRRGTGRRASLGRERPGRRAGSRRRERPKRPLDSRVRQPLIGERPLYLRSLRRAASNAVATTACRARAPSRWREAQTAAA